MTSLTSMEITDAPASPRATCNAPGTAEVVLALLQAPPASAILDLGCYEGAMSSYLLAQGHEVTSCDLVRREGTRSLPRFDQVDANKPLPCADAAFDAVVCTDVIEHLENPAQLMRECARILRPRGVLILSTPDVSNFYSRFCYALRGGFPLFRAREFEEWNHISPISLSWLQMTARRVGLRVEEVRGEAAPPGRRRRLLQMLLYPLFYAASGRQTGVLNRGITLIVRLNKPQ